MQTSGTTSERRICAASTVHVLAPAFCQQFSTLVCRWCTEMYMPQERDGSEFSLLKHYSRHLQVQEQEY